MADFNAFKNSGKRSEINWEGSVGDECWGL